MADPLSNPDAEAAILVAGKSKTPPPLPQGSLATDAAPAAAPTAPAAAAVPPVANPAAIATAIATVETAIKQIAATGAVTSDLSLATASRKSALTWLTKAAAAAAVAAKA